MTRQYRSDPNRQARRVIAVHTYCRGNFKTSANCVRRSSSIPLHWANGASCPFTFPFHRPRLVSGAPSRRLCSRRRRYPTTGGTGVSPARRASLHFPFFAARRSRPQALLTNHQAPTANYDISRAETAADSSSVSGHIPTLPRQGIGFGSLFTFERSHQFG